MAQMIFVVVVAIGLMLPGMSFQAQKGDGFDGFGAPDPFNQNDDDQVDAGEPNAPAAENPDDDANMVSDDGDSDDDSFAQVASKKVSKKGDGFDGFGTPDPFNQNDDDQVDAGEPNAPSAENPDDDANMVSDDDNDDDSFVQVASKQAAKKGDGFDGFGIPDPFNQNDDDQVDAGEPNAPAAENPNDDANMVSDDDDSDDDSLVQVATKTAVEAKDGKPQGKQITLRTKKIPKAGKTTNALSGLSLSQAVWPWRHHSFGQQPAAAPSGAPSGAQALQDLLSADAASPAPATAEVKADAAHAREAATVAKQAAKVANKVAQHSIKITAHAKKALKHALGALHDARVESTGLGKSQKVSLKKAEAHLRKASKAADFGKLKKMKDASDLQKDKMQGDLEKVKSGRTEEEDLEQQIDELRRKLKAKHVDDSDINKALDELQANRDDLSNDEVKAEIERLRELIDKLEEPEDVRERKISRGNAKEHLGEKRENLSLKPLEGSGESGHAAAKIGETVTPIEDKGIDIDTQMPYGDLEPFGREDTAQELTESSITESDQMVDQLERAEVAEEKRAVFRALTRLRGAAITSFDGVARSQTGNIDEYNKINKWRKSHPLHHLADEESDVTKWAFPDNAD